MGLVDAKCPMCGKNIKADNSIEKVFCQYCGSSFFSKAAISFFNNSNLNSVEEAMQKGCSSDFEIVGGVLVKYNGTNLDIVIPEGVKRINGSVFARMYIKSVSLSKSVVEIGESAFSECSELENFSAGSGLQIIGKGAFSSCINLKNVNLNEGLQKIDQYAFCKSGVESIVIPLSVKEIAADAFRECLNLLSVKILNSETLLGHGSFEGCISLTKFSGKTLEMFDKAIIGSNFLPSTKRTNRKILMSVIPQESWNSQSYGEFEKVAFYVDDKYRDIVMEEAKRIAEERRAKGLCSWCGCSQYTGLLEKRCIKCGLLKGVKRPASRIDSFDWRSVLGI